MKQKGRKRVLSRQTVSIVFVPRNFVRPALTRWQFLRHAVHVVDLLRANTDITLTFVTFCPNTTCVRRPVPTYHICCCEEIMTRVEDSSNPSINNFAPTFIVTKIHGETRLLFEARQIVPLSYLTFMLVMALGLTTASVFVLF